MVEQRRFGWRRRGQIQSSKTCGPPARSVVWPGARRLAKTIRPSAAVLPASAGGGRPRRVGQRGEQLKKGHTMTVVELFPVDAYNQMTIDQGHPPNWINRD